MNTLHHVRMWATERDDDRDALYELMKIPARLGMHDEDLGLVPADLRYFENVIAPSGYAAVSKAANLDAARRRGNARVRALLKRYFAATSHTAPTDHRGDWDALINHVEALEGFPDRGARFSTGTSRALTTLRARAQCAPAALDQAEVDRIAWEASSDKRRSVRKGVRLINRLIESRDEHQEIAHLLPQAILAIPSGSGRARRIIWKTLPPAFRGSVDAALLQATETVADQAAETRARIAAGEDRDAVIAEFNSRKRSRQLGNRSAARMGYRQAIIWVTRAAIERGSAKEDLGDLWDVLTPELIEAAISDHVRRAEAAPGTLKDAKASQTIHSRLVALRLVARHGLHDRALAEDIDLVAAQHADLVNPPGSDGMVEEIRLFLRELLRAPHVACGLVNAPARIAAEAGKRLEEARAAGSEARELTALRIHAAAVLFALQMSRPVRSGNLIRARINAAGGKLHRLIWIKRGTHAEILFPSTEVKNNMAVPVTILGEDARILWRWTSELRARYIDLRGIQESCYLIPGEAKPRLLKDGLRLPRGCISPSTLAEIWDEGCRIIGLSMHPHMCRHAIATLVLALEPGNYAKAASVLGITEATVRKHYGHEDGQRASAEVRKALLANHPDMFKLLRRKTA